MELEAYERAKVTAELDAHESIRRPARQCARYATPIVGLYLCGSGSHPGGGITCAPGFIAANTILKNRR